MEEISKIYKMTAKIEHDYEHAKAERILSKAPKFLKRIPGIHRKLPQAIHEYEKIRHRVRMDGFKVVRTAKKDWQTGSPLHFVIVICTFVSLWIITCRVCPYLGNLGWMRRQRLKE